MSTIATLRMWPSPSTSPSSDSYSRAAPRSVKRPIRPIPTTAAEWMAPSAAPPSHAAGQGVGK
ncbi:hypothetical protein ACFWRZ_21740 [Streptomyces rubiginosohelvolus]|uniref:hypothetical protein n=1 Tax=Streptomyces rubiginosohelvolus TaxID=67362 RepID=UPI003646047A